MGNFRYIAVDRKGKRTEGTLGGYTREEVSSELRKMGLKPVNVKADDAFQTALVKRLDLLNDVDRFDKLWSDAARTPGSSDPIYVFYDIVGCVVAFLPCFMTLLLEFFCILFFNMSAPIWQVKPGKNYLYWLESAGYPEDLLSPNHSKAAGICLDAPQERNTLWDTLSSLTRLIPFS